MEFQSDHTLSNISASPTAPPFTDMTRSDIYKIPIDDTPPTYEEAMQLHNIKKS